MFSYNCLMILLILIAEQGGDESPDLESKREVFRFKNAVFFSFAFQTRNKNNLDDKMKLDENILRLQFEYIYQVGHKGSSNLRRLLVCVVGVVQHTCVLLHMPVIQSADSREGQHQQSFIVVFIIFQKRSLTETED